MKAGAHDYVLKDNLSRLLPAINRELQEAKERDARRKTDWELQHFVASLTHDLRTPILAEKRILELIEAGNFAPTNDALSEVIRELLQSNQFLQHIVDNILYAYKYQKSQIQLRKEMIDTVAFIDNLVHSVTIQSLLKDKKLRIVVRAPESLPAIEMDPNEIRRVWLNLIKNAVDYSPLGESISILAERSPYGLRFCIEDNSAGVCPEIKDQLFMPYMVSVVKKYRQVGVGLGLYLCKQIVEAHGGRIGYQSGAERGSRFYFELPLTEPDL